NSLPAGPDGSSVLFQEARAGMLDAAGRQRSDLREASLPSEFGQLVLVVNQDGTPGQLLRLQTPVEKAQRLAEEQRQQQEEESRRRAQEAERRAQEAERRALEAERQAADAHRRAREAQQLAAEALQHAEQAEQQAKSALKEMQLMARTVVSMMQQTVRKQTS